MSHELAEAFQIVAQTCAKTPMTWAEHLVVQKALEAIHNALNPRPVEPEDIPFKIIPKPPKLDA